MRYCPNARAPQCLAPLMHTGPLNVEPVCKRNEPMAATGMSALACVSVCIRIGARDASRLDRDEQQHYRNADKAQAKGDGPRAWQVAVCAHELHGPLGSRGARHPRAAHREAA
eukprot:6198619-Pleurochrysis_carterae.AAC.3